MISNFLTYIVNENEKVITLITANTEIKSFLFDSRKVGR